MNIKRFVPVLFLLVACVASPQLKTYYIGPGVIQYFLSPSEWNVKNTKNEKVLLDIVYRSNSELPVIVNISFINKDQNPHKITSAVLIGEGVEYRLRDIKVLYSKSKNNELRISSTGSPKALIPLLESKSIVLWAVVDGMEYVYDASKDFYALKDQFLAEVRY
jgi:hypothetical protein